MLDNTFMDEDVVQLLSEADCPDEFTEQFLTTLETEDVNKQLRLLRTQRCRQLEQVHKEEKKLDLLDFLLYKLEKQLPPPPTGKKVRIPRKGALL